MLNPKYHQAIADGRDIYDTSVRYSATIALVKPKDFALGDRKYNKTRGTGCERIQSMTKCIIFPLIIINLVLKFADRKTKGDDLCASPAFVSVYCCLKNMEKLIVSKFGEKSTICKFLVKD